VQAAEEAAEAEGTAAAAEHVEELRAQLQLAETNARDLESEAEAQAIASELDVLRQARPSPIGGCTLPHSAATPVRARATGCHLAHLACAEVTEYRRRATQRMRRARGHELRG
jgi:hypothetical protein